MPATTKAAKSLTLEVARESEVLPLAGILAMTLQRGDVVALSGDLGAGKTTFAPALIRDLPENRNQEAPSPAYTFLQTDECKRFPIVHDDLYRLSDLQERTELGFDDLPE